jgi:hypothetical protein
MFLPKLQLLDTRLSAVTNQTQFQYAFHTSQKSNRYVLQEMARQDLPSLHTCAIACIQNDWYTEAVLHVLHDTLDASSFAPHSLIDRDGA